uniref:BTB domain-containing protein n=1 Tax=Panagrellus redivivus TaxID=6233 RepID=A0A7E4VM28_PANRE
MSYGDYHLYLCKHPSDVTIIVGDKKFRAHRSVLSKRSGFFRTLFSSDSIDAESNEIILQEKNLKTFEVVLNYIYDDKYLFWNYTTIDISVVMDKNFTLLLCAQYYKVDALVKTIIEQLKKYDPALVLNKALAYQVDELVTSSTQLIQRQPLTFKPLDRMFLKLWLVECEQFPIIRYFFPSLWRTLTFKLSSKYFSR